MVSGRPPSTSNGAIRGPAMTDVASLAGVSHQTVSRVINKHPNVTPTTRTRVLAAIEELGYRRNNAARALVTGRSQTLDVVTVDQHAGAQSATEHLLSLGHSTVWHVAGPTDWLEARQRTAGWRSTLERAGLEVPPPLRGDWSPRSGFEAGRVLARMPEVSAVFVANDSMAVGVYRAFDEHGLSVPGDVSIVGFDDVPEAAYVSPPLTTVRQDFAEVARRSLALLLDQISSGTRAAKRQVVGTTLVVRDSTRSVDSAPVESTRRKRMA